LRADVEKGTDVGMVEGRDGLRFAFETEFGRGIRAEMIWEDFDCDITAEPGVAGAIDFARAACAKRRKDFVLF